MATLTYLFDTPNAPTIYIACTPEHYEDYLKPLAEEILAVRECRICYTHRTPEAPERVAPPTDTQLILLPLDFSLLALPPAYLEEEIQLARETHIPLLPVLMEQNIQDMYSLPHKFGKLPRLQYAPKVNALLTFREALTLALQSLLLPQDLMAEACNAPENLPKGSRQDLLMGIAKLAGLGVPRDTEAAFRLLHKAANAGDPTAILCLLRAYNAGIGVPPDNRAAFHYGSRLLQYIKEQEAIPQWEQQLRFLVDLAFFYIRIDYRDEGVRAIRRLHLLCHNKLGATHASTRLYAALLATIVQRYQHDHPTVEELVREQYLAVAKLLGELHPETLHRRMQAALLLPSVGEKEEGLRELSAVYRSYCTTLGETSAEAQEALYQLASMCHDTNHNDHALQLAEKLHQQQLSCLGRKELPTLRTLQLMVHIQSSRQEKRAATRMQRQLYLALRRQLDNNHPQVLTAQMHLAILLHGQKENSTALEHMSNAHNAFRNLYGADFFLTRYTARLLQQWQKGEDD